MSDPYEKMLPSRWILCASIHLEGSISFCIYNMIECSLATLSAKGRAWPYRAP